MPREFSSVNLSIWQDDDWRSLPPAAQHLYLTLWTHPGLSYCGVVDWRPGRLAALSNGWTSKHVREVADCLEARLFIVTDDDTEECLIRSWVRFDGLLKQPRLAVSFANAYAETASKTLRGVIAHEMAKLREREPNMIGWTKPQVVSVVESAQIDPRSRALPKDPFGDGFASGLALGLAQTQGDVSGSVSLPPTPAPAPAPEHQHLEGAADADAAPKKSRKPARQIPADWQPAASAVEFARGHGIDVEREAFKFRNHATSNGRTLVDWDRGFLNWLDKALDFNPPQRPDRSHLPEAWR